MLTKQRKKYENLEIIEQSGQEDEQRAQKAISELSRLWESDQFQKKADILNKLDLRKNFNDYIPLLAKITSELIIEEALDKEIKWHVYYDKIGVIVVVAIGERIFRRAFRACRKPVYDFNACQRFARAVADLETKREKEPTIFLPNGQPVS